MDLTLNDLQGYQKFQNSDLDAKLGALDNFSNSMFQAGNLEEAKRAQEYRAQLEVDSLASTPAAQALAGVSQAIGGRRDLEFSIGTEAYDRINKTYSDRVNALTQPADIFQVNPGEYVYTRPNPFGDGAMVEYDGGSKFIGVSNPRSIKALVDSEKLPTIKKDEIYDSLVDRLTPILRSDGPDIGIQTADQLLSDPAFQSLPLGDKRALARRFMLKQNDFQDATGVNQGNILLQSLDKEYNAQQIAGALAPENAPDEFPDLGVVGQATLALQANKQEWFTTAIDRGTQRWLNQWDLKAAQSAFKESDRLFKTFTPEQQQFLQNGQFLDQVVNASREDAATMMAENEGVIPAGQSRQISEILKGTPLEGVSPMDVAKYAHATKGYQQANENFILRGKALSLIPQTKGAQDVQDVQSQLAQTDAGWQYKAAITAGAIASHPLDVIANASLESFVSQPLSTAATAALFAIPGGQTPGAALATNLLRGTGTGLIAGIADSSYTYTEELNKARYNQDGTERPLAEVLADPVAMKQVNDNAFLHGVSVGTVEGVTGYLLPGIMNPLDRTLAKGAYVAAGRNKPIGIATKSLLFNAAEMGLQGTSEGAGELLGQVAQSKDPDIGSVLMEAASGLAGPDFFAMYQAPEHLNEAARQISTTEAAFERSQEMIRKSEQIDADYEQALTEEASGNPAKGVYARGFVPMIEIGPADATGMANVHAFYEEAALEGEPAPIATTTQGLEEVQPNASEIEGSNTQVFRPEGEGTSEGVGLQGISESEQGQEVTEESQEAQPIEGQIQEGQEVSYLTEDGEVRSGKVENLDGGSFTLDGKHQSFRPGKYFSGVLKPKNNAPRVELGDVLFDGQNFWKSVGDDKFVHGYKQKGEIIFDDSDQRKLGKDVINDPRVDLYSKPDFDAAQQEYNGRENPQDSDRFTDLLRNTPQKQEPASAPTPPPPAEPVTEDSVAGNPVTGPTPEEQAVTDIQAPPIPKKRTTIFNLRVHKDTGTLLAGAVERMNEWMGKTKIFEVSKDQITYAKDGKVQQLFRSQAPESFDETVKTLTEEDQSFRNHKDPTNWTEVPHYREMEQVLQQRVTKTAQSKNKNKRQRGILEAAQVSSILQALFVQDRAIAAWVSKRFNLYTPNASLITVEDVAKLRYGNVADWKLSGEFGRRNKAGEIVAAPNSYDPMARLIQLTGNANVTDVFHELYHDFLNTIAPIILDNAEYVRLQQFLESRLAQKPFRDYLKKRYRNEEGAVLTDADFTFFNKAGNISVAAHEAFAQMMTRFHHDGRAIRGLAQEDQSVLNTITNFYVQTFQDLNRTPIATTTDDAHDLLSNFFLTPPLLRREAFKPEARMERINDDLAEETLTTQQLADSIAGLTDEAEEIEESQLPAPAQLIGDKLADDFQPGESPRQGVPFTSGGRSYVLEGERVSEIIASGSDNPYPQFPAVSKITDAGLTGVRPENILLFNQGVNYGRVAMIVSILDKDISAYDSRRKKKISGVVFPDSLRSQIEREKGITDRHQAFVYALDRAKELRELAKSNRLPVGGLEDVSEVVVNTFAVAQDLRKVERQVEEKPWDGQSVFPPDGANIPAGTQKVSDENLPQTSAPEASTKPVIKTVISVPETDSIRTILTDPDTGMVISDKTRKKRAKKPKEKKWTPPAQPKKGPDNGFRLYSIEDDAQYKRGRMGIRIGARKEGISRALRHLAENDVYRVAPRQFTVGQVQARIESMPSIKAQLQDLNALLRKTDAQLDRIFDPERRHGDIGRSALQYYALAIQSQLNQISYNQDNGLDLDIDKNDTMLFLDAIQTRIESMNRSAGRAVDINKEMLTYSPKNAIAMLNEELVRSNAAFKAYLRKVQDFAKKYKFQTLTDQQFDEAMAEARIPVMFKNALRLYSKDPTKESLRDFEMEAAKVWAKNPKLAAVRPEIQKILRDLSHASQSSKWQWNKGYYARLASLVVEGERGPGVLDTANAMMMNNMLVSVQTSGTNIAGSAIKFFFDSFTYLLTFMGQDAISLNPRLLQKNLGAVVKAAEMGVSALEEAGTEATAIMLSGERGASVEMYEKALGYLPSSQVLLYGRPGTNYADRTRWQTTIQRMVAILLTDTGRRLNSGPDSFYKIFSENYMIGAQLYRKAFDEFYAEGGKGSRSDFIAQRIDETLGVKALTHYQALASEELKSTADLILELTPSALSRPKELSTLRNLMAFNMRREDRENGINAHDPQIMREARAFAHNATFSNDAKGMALAVKQILQIPAYMGIGKYSLSSLVPTDTFYVGGKKTEVDGVEVIEGGAPMRASTGGPIFAILNPFPGNQTRMAEIFWDWTGMGILNKVVTNHQIQKDGKFQKWAKKTGESVENYPDAYTKLEVAASGIQGALGWLAMGTVLAFFGGTEKDDEKRKRGLVGFRNRSIFGRNGKETFVPPYSFWWRTKDGNIAYLNFKEYPQLLASVGTAATYMEKVQENPDAPWPMMFHRIGMSMFVGSMDSGTYEGVMSLADFVKKAQGEEPDALDIQKGLEANTAKYAKAYLVPLNRFQKECLAFSVLGGRGYSVVPDKSFFPTFYANTYLEGWLSQEDSEKLGKMIGPTGEIKEADILSRFGGVIKSPSPGLEWMVANDFTLNRTDYQRPIAGWFTKQAQKEQAEAEFAQMNNGMFFVKHASEIEKKSSDYYWKWIESYSKDEKRQAEIKAFVNSETNQLKKRQGSSGYKTERDIQQADINAIVTQARSIGALQAASDYYTDNPRVKLWSQTIAIRKIQSGYELPDLKVNRLLEQKAAIPSRP